VKAMLYCFVQGRFFLCKNFKNTLQSKLEYFICMKSDKIPVWFFSCF
jgi:hypothetical protein